MRTILTIALTILTAFSIAGCRSAKQSDVNTAQEMIAASINHNLEQAGADMALSQLKLKNAPKASGYTWVGTATFASGGGTFNQEITVSYQKDENSITWWYSDNPDDIFYISNGNPVEEPLEYEYSFEIETAQPVQNAVNTQTTELIGKVEQKGTTFTTFNIAGREITHFSSPNMQLVGWGRDFFVIRSGTTFKTYDARCKQITSITVGGATIAAVEADTFTVKVGSSSQKYDRRGNRK